MREKRRKEENFALDLFWNIKKNFSISVSVCFGANRRVKCCLMTKILRGLLSEVII